MEDDIDIYEDLPSFEVKLDENLVRSDEEEEKVADKYGELRRKVEELTNKLEDTRRIKRNLEVNLSSLLKTAKAEIARKDRMIADLRKELDDATFRRGNYARTGADFVSRKTSRRQILLGTVTPHKSPLEFYPTEHADHVAVCVASSERSDDVDRQRQSRRQVPCTVFGERLRKRIADEEENASKGTRKQGRFVPEGDFGESAPSVDAYVAESDKENNSRRNARNEKDNSKLAGVPPRAASVENSDSQTKRVEDGVELAGEPAKRTTVEAGAVARFTDAKRQKLIGADRDAPTRDETFSKVEYSVSDRRHRRDYSRRIEKEDGRVDVQPLKRAKKSRFAFNDENQTFDRRGRENSSSCRKNIYRNLALERQDHRKSKYREDCRDRRSTDRRARNASSSSDSRHRGERYEKHSSYGANCKYESHFSRLGNEPRDKDCYDRARRAVRLHSSVDRNFENPAESYPRKFERRASRRRSTERSPTPEERGERNENAEGQYCDTTTSGETSATKFDEKSNVNFEKVTEHIPDRTHSRLYERSVETKNSSSSAVNIQTRDSSSFEDGEIVDSPNSSPKKGENLVAVLPLVWDGRPSKKQGQRDDESRCASRIVVAVSEREGRPKNVEQFVHDSNLVVLSSSTASLEENREDPYDPAAITERHIDDAFEHCPEKSHTIDASRQQWENRAIFQQTTKTTTKRVEDSCSGDANGGVIYTIECSNSAGVPSSLDFDDRSNETNERKQTPTTSKRLYSGGQSSTSRAAANQAERIETMLPDDERTNPENSRVSVMRQENVQCTDEKGDRKNVDGRNSKIEEDSYEKHRVKDTNDRGNDENVDDSNCGEDEIEDEEVDHSSDNAGEEEGEEDEEGDGEETEVDEENGAEEAESKKREKMENPISGNDRLVEKVGEMPKESCNGHKGGSLMNINGKVVVFARRKNPVRLVDNDANMTIVVDSRNVNGDPTPRNPLNLP